MTRHSARDARRWFDPAIPTHVLDRASRSSARAVLAARGDGYLLVEVVGEVDIASRPELTDLLGRAVDCGTTAVIADLSAVTLLSAAGIGCLQEASNRLAERRGRLYVVCPPGAAAARVLRLLDPDCGRPLHPDVAAAVATVRGRA